MKQFQRIQSAPKVPLGARTPNSEDAMGTSGFNPESPTPLHEDKIYLE